MIWYLYWKTWQKYWEERSHLDYYLIIIRLYSINSTKALLSNTESIYMTWWIDWRSVDVFDDQQRALVKHEDAEMDRHSQSPCVHVCDGLCSWMSVIVKANSSRSQSRKWAAGAEGGTGNKLLHTPRDKTQDTRHSFAHTTWKSDL